MTSVSETIVIVHGIWMHGLLMGVLAQRLARAGFRTRTFSYDFLKSSPAENGDALAEFVRTLDRGPDGHAPLHLVGHSLGGIVILHCLDRHPDLDIAKTVLIGSPVRGSQVAKKIHGKGFLRPLLGRSIEGGLVDGAPEFRGQCPLGIITGKGGVGMTSFLYPLSEPGDGVVADSETLIERASERTMLPRSHSALLFSGQCAELVVRFLRKGTFR